MAPTLTDEQNEALDFLVSSDADQIGLFGAAGTGKTTVVGRFCDLVDDPTVLAAPTHKAAGVLRQKAPADVPCQTIHSLLACEKRYDKERGTVQFEPNPDREMIGSFGVVIVDECSMIGDQMYDWICAAQERNPSVNIIFLGDPYQLRPVDDGNHSPTFDVPSVELETIMRHDGPIQRSCDAVREAMIESREPPTATPNGIEIRDLRGDAETFFGRYLDEPDRGKILAYENDDVDFCNQHIRRRVYGDRAERPYLEGERLVLARTYEADESAGAFGFGGVEKRLFHTGTECTALEVDKDVKHGLDCWRLRLEDDLERTFVAYAFGSDDQRSAYRDRLDDLNPKKGTGGYWPDYFDVKEAFAKIRPGYATTIHKSQGSTYPRVFLLQSELEGLWDQELEARLLYVAYSRASEEICLL